MWCLKNFVAFSSAVKEAVGGGQNLWGHLCYVVLEKLCGFFFGCQRGGWWRGLGWLRLHIGLRLLFGRFGHRLLLFFLFFLLNRWWLLALGGSLSSSLLPCGFFLHFL